MLSRSLSAAIKSGAVAASSAASLAENPHHSAALLAALSSSDPDAALRGIDFVPSALSLRNAMDTAPTAAAAIKCFAWASALPRFRGHKLNDERRYASQHSNLSPANVHILANAFLQAGALDAAMRLLRELPSGADLSAYVSVMLGLCRAKRSIDAIAVLRDMERSNIVPELSTYSMLIVAKTSSYSYIICGLAKYGFFNEAVELFEAMAERKISPPLGSCIAILNGYCQDGRKMELAMEFFRKMADEYKCPPSTYAYNVLLMGLKKVDRVDAMQEMFLEMRDKGLEPDRVTYSTYILGLCKAGRIDDAIVVKKDMMQRSCSPDSVAYSILINALCKVGKLDDGENMLQEMLDKNLKPDAICFGSLIDCLENSGRSNDALDLYRKMVEIGCKPDAAVASVMVDSLARRGAVLQALEFFDELLKRDFALPSPVSVNNLVKKIVIGDEVERGVGLLKTMSSRGLRPLQCSYATMVKELCRRRNADETLEL